MKNCRVERSCFTNRPSVTTDWRWSGNVCTLPLPQFTQCKSERTRPIEIEPHLQIHWWLRAPSELRFPICHL